mmetsp:Transcript_95745/g.310241  ORF Transcript_95745/g.310241 Transcript_95745/m.310241 type:complete len:253 (+) Transcript_95745:6-764(+)
MQPGSLAHPQTSPPIGAKPGPCPRTRLQRRALRSEGAQGAEGAKSTGPRDDGTTEVVLQLAHADGTALGNNALLEAIQRRRPRDNSFICFWFLARKQSVRLQPHRRELAESVNGHIQSVQASTTVQASVQASRHQGKHAPVFVDFLPGHGKIVLQRLQGVLQLLAAHHYTWRPHAAQLDGQTQGSLPQHLLHPSDTQPQDGTVLGGGREQVHASHAALAVEHRDVPPQGRSHVRQFFRGLLQRLKIAENSRH